MNLFTPVFQIVQNIVAVLGPLFAEKQILHASNAEALDEFGYSVGISGDGTRLIVGASKEDGPTNSTSASGAAYIYRDSNGTWVEEDILYASDPGGAALFAIDVAISEDGTRVIVGAQGDDTSGAGTGAAYVFSRSGTTWTEEQKLMAIDKAGGDYFGFSVSITDDGTRAIIGAYQKDGTFTGEGAAYVFSRSGATWTQEQKLTASDPEYQKFLGIDVSISNDGTRVIAGARGADEPTNNEGAAYVFSRSGTTWTEEQKLTTPNPQQSDWFGYSVDISEDGSIVAVSAHLSDEANPADPDWNSGSIHTFTRSGTTWTHEATLYDPDGNKPDAIGEDLAMTPDGSRIITASMGSNGPNGKAYIFDRSGTTWTQAPIITASDGQSNDQFGSAVAISNDGTKLVIGARDEDGGPGDPLADAGAAYVFEEV